MFFLKLRNRILHTYETNDNISFISCSSHLRLVYKYAVPIALGFSPMTIQFHKLSLSLCIQTWLNVILHHVHFWEDKTANCSALSRKSDTCNTPVHFLRLPSSNIAYRPDYLSPYFDVTPISMTWQSWVMDVCFVWHFGTEVMQNSTGLSAKMVQWMSNENSVLQINTSHTKFNLPIHSRFIELSKVSTGKCRTFFILAFSMCYT
jgi:hypothetical protein